MTVTPESVRELLGSSDFSDRLHAINLIRQLEPTIAFELIQTVIEDNNVRVRYAAVSQVATLGKQDPAKALILLRGRMYRDSEADVQAAAADAIGALQLTEAFDDLKQLYERTSEWLVRFSIIATLGELGDPRGFELLEEALKSDQELLRMVAIGSLGELGDARAIDLLIPFASDPDWQVRYRVTQALGRFKDAAARPILEKLATDEVSQIAQEAQAGLQA
ncbi:MAG: HEAT repeat domain-containing protein [Scytolyngbya sp. HA4215-MV1]|jgi:HEAT repeat protein|nr:HEAT repeat domain-containing protein [Scytolyngbya sp. HA4215-MV1]